MHCTFLYKKLRGSSSKAQLTFQFVTNVICILSEVMTLCSTLFPLKGCAPYLLIGDVTRNHSVTQSSEIDCDT